MRTYVQSPKIAKSLLSQVNWRQLSQKTKRELHNREIHAPVVSVYRWWARRPHSVMGAILDAAVGQFGDAMTVSDPFSGGGTVTFEATRRGLKAYAQDLYPWPAQGLAAALSDANPEELERAARDLLTALEPLRQHYRTPAGNELSHIIRVRATICAHCQNNYFLFPQPLISLLRRSPKEKHAFFGCAACGSVSKRPRTLKVFGCGDCGHRQSTNETLPGCPHCDHEHAET